MSFSSIFSRYVGLPIVDMARKTHALDELRKLKKSEYLSIDQLEVLQFEKLSNLLLHCQENVPYYTELFSKHGFDAKNFKATSDLEVLPVLTKDDIRSNFEQMKARDFDSYRPRIKETGGSTGQPLRMYHDELSHGTMWANIYRGFGHGGYQLGDKYLTIASGSLVPKKLRFGMAAYFFLQNSLIIPGYYLEQDYMKQILDLIKTRKPRFIYAYSSSLVSLARAISGENRKVEGLKAIFTTADMLYPDQRKLIENVLNAPVYDNYGCPEAGVMTWECQLHDGYHYNMESCLIEIVDQDSEGIGRIISTNLTNYAFPIVRYDTGDIARIERSGKCECGRSHNKVKSLLGRQRDILTLSNGRMVHGAFFNHFQAFYDSKAITRYQIIQKSLDQVEVHLQLEDNASMSDQQHIKKLLEQALDGLVNIELIEGDFRISSYSNKHRVVISDVDNKWTTD